jgi:hypothetical protein
MKLPTLLLDGEGRRTYLNENCQNRWVDFRGNRGDTQAQPYGVAREALADAVQDGNRWI